MSVEASAHSIAPVPSSSSSIIEDEQSVVYKQRLRTLAFYKQCGIAATDLIHSTTKAPTNTKTTQKVKVHLWDGNSYEAAYFHGADSQETKFAVSGLVTDWGEHRRGLIVRGSDLVRLEVTL